MSLITFERMFHIHRGAIVTIAILLTSSFLSVGCDGKDSGVSKNSGTPTSTALQPAPGQPGAPTPTAEQEAARKRGEEMGPAIQAANEAADEAAQKGN